jgi:hypothetical protein
MWKGHLAGISSVPVFTLAMLAEGVRRSVVVVWGSAAAFTTPASVMYSFPAASATAVVTSSLVTTPLLVGICTFSVLVDASSVLLFLGGKGGSLDRVIAASFVVDLLYHRVEFEVAFRAHIASYDLHVVRVGLFDCEDKLV